MIVKLVRENTAYYIQESLIMDLYSKPVTKFRLLDLSEIAIDLDTDAVLKSHKARVESVYDKYVASLNRAERESGELPSKPRHGKLVAIAEETSV